MTPATRSDGDTLTVNWFGAASHNFVESGAAESAQPLSSCQGLDLLRSHRICLCLATLLPHAIAAARIVSKDRIACMPLCGHVDALNSCRPAQSTTSAILPRRP